MAGKLFGLNAINAMSRQLLEAQLLEQIEGTNALFHRLGFTERGPWHGPPIPATDIEGLSVYLEDGKLHVNSGGWESETVELGPVDVAELIQFLATWLPVLQTDEE